MERIISAGDSGLFLVSSYPVMSNWLSLLHPSVVPQFVTRISEVCCSEKIKAPSCIMQLSKPSEEGTVNCPTVLDAFEVSTEVLSLFCVRRSAACICVPILYFRESFYERQTSQQ